MTALVAVQTARRAAAQEAMQAAGRREQSARTASEQAADRSRIAQEEWLGLVSSAGFSPEYSRVLADRLIESEGEADLTSLRVRSAAELHEHRKAEWQQLEAQGRSSAESLKRLRRRIQRRHEEKRLGSLADMITFAGTRS